jgi:hypothetical protein
MAEKNVSHTMLAIATRQLPTGFLILWLIALASFGGLFIGFYLFEWLREKIDSAQLQQRNKTFFGWIIGIFCLILGLSLSYSFVLLAIKVLDKKFR